MKHDKLEQDTVHIILERYLSDFVINVTGSSLDLSELISYKIQKLVT